MAKTSAAPSPAPEPKLPKIDLDALFGAQKANLATAHEAESVLLGAAQAIAKAQHGYLEQAVADARAAVIGGTAAKGPEAVAAQLKAAAERTAAATKEVVDLAVAAQRQVVELFTRRTRANVEELQALAA
jgi:flagellar biosynthesis/type III secretory pathway protein FliH